MPDLESRIDHRTLNQVRLPADNPMTVALNRETGLSRKPARELFKLPRR